MIIIGFVVVLFIYLVIWRRQKSIATAIQILAAFSGLAASILWLFNISFVTITPLAALFLVLTIVGERIELGRVGGLTIKGETFGLALSMLTIMFAIATIIWGTIAFTLLGITVMILVGWLFVVDIARSTEVPPLLVPAVMLIRSVLTAFSGKRPRTGSGFYSPAQSAA